MKYACFTVIVLVVTFLIGCQQDSTGTDTPVAQSIPTLPLQAQSTTLVTLIRNPISFEGSYLQLSGQYERLPLTVCAEEGNFSPATWALVDGGIEILASGFDGILRRLAEPGLPLVVEGRWQQWQGPVGCDRRAPVEEIWYLAVNNIVSPNPLAPAQDSVDGIVSLPIEPTAGVSGETGSEAGGLGEAPIIPTASQTPIATSTPSGIIVPTATRTAIPTSAINPISSATSTQVTSATTSVTVTTTATPSPSLTSRPGAATSTPSGTPSNSGTPGSINTATPDLSPTADDNGTTLTIEYDDLVKETLSGGGIDSWSFVGDSGDIISIGLGPGPSLDASIELIDPNGASIIKQNQGLAGQPENINQRSLNMSGVYEIVVKSEANSSDAYALTLQTDDSQPFVAFQGNIGYGENRSNTAPIDVDDMWNFLGVAGDVITIRAMASGSADLVLYLNDPDAFEIMYADDNTVDGPPNDEEMIDQYTLPKTGLYSIGVGEADFKPYGYTITLEKDS